MKKIAVWFLTICTVLTVTGVVLFAEPEEENTPTPTAEVTKAPTAEPTDEPTEAPTREPEKTPDHTPDDTVTATPKNKVTTAPKVTNKPKSTSGSSSGSGWEKATDIPDDPNRRTNAPPTLPPDEDIKANTPVPAPQGTEAPVQAHESVMDSKQDSFILIFAVLLLLLLVDILLIILRERYLSDHITSNPDGVVRRRTRDVFNDDDDD